MLTILLTGKRLYVTTYLYTPWDKVFYPEGPVKVSLPHPMNVSYFTELIPARLHDDDD